ncbi:toxin VasX [Kangiella sp.]|uniref:toxin VasX n=1 Tax=Kangiella sp. TaxID=1920245 RepID=UPI0019BDA60D|nr:toxin VasX [Kangiella sp.]MBD3653789.1 hypothetical protein [Kangiella sp.]
MGRENFSATQSAIDPVLPCEKGIRAIFPVRFAIKPSVLTVVSQRPRAISPETNILDTGDHELRRIRQGYIYIFVPNEIEDVASRTEAANGYWMVFRYQSQLNDFNSPVLEEHGQIPFSIRNPDTDPYVGVNYSFRQYTWLDGYAAGRWGFNNSKVYPYVYVPKQVTKIEMAYSEHRWPAKFFEQAEVDAEFRKKLMVPIDLAPEQTDFTLPLSELENHVIDFKQELFSLSSFLTDYADCHTGVYPQNANDVLSCVKEQETSRIVALHDPVGRVLDINERIHKNDNESTAFSLAHQYPLTTAKAITQIKDTIDDANFIKDFIYDDIVVEETIWQELLDSENLFSAINRRLLIAHQEALTFGQAWAINHQLDAILSMISGTSKEHDFELITYASNTLNQLFLGVGNTVAGSEYQMKTIAGTGGNAKISKTIDQYLNAWWKIAVAVKTGVQENLNSALAAAESFDSFLKVNGSELGKLQFQYSNQKFMNILKQLYGIDGVAHRPVKVDEVEEIIKSGSFGQLSADSPFSAGKTNISHESSNVIGYQQSLGKTINSTTSMNTIDLQYVTIEGEFYPSSGFQEKALSQVDTRVSMAGLSAFLNFSGLFFLVENHKNNNAKTTLGKIAQNTVLNSIVLTGSLINDIYECRQTYANGNFVRTSSKGIANKLYSELGKNKTLKQLGNFASKIKVGAISGPRVSQLAGKALGGIGVVLTAFTAYEGFKTGNKAQGYGNTMAAFGSTLLLAGALIGPIGVGIAIFLIAAGLITEWFGSLNPIEEWAYKSFWGKSDYYWGEKNPRREIAELIRISTSLSNPEDPDFAKTKRLLESEMRAFQDLFLQPRLVSVDNKSKSFQLFLPRYHEAGNPPEVNISVREMYQVTPSNYSPGLRYNNHSNVPFRMSVHEPVASVDISHLVRNKNLGLSVSVEYRDPYGTAKKLPSTSLTYSQYDR